MKRVFIFIFLTIPIFNWAEDLTVNNLLQIDVIVKVETNETDDLWSVDVSKYTISERSISINLKGFDGELIAKLTPKIMDGGKILLKTECEVKSDNKKNTSSISQKELIAEYDEKILFFPLGGSECRPTVIMELVIKKFNGESV